MNPIVIIGSGLAAYTLARELRKLDKLVPLTLVTREDGHFYAKPMLSNALAQGKTPAQLVNTDSAAMAQQLGLGLLTCTQVLSVDAAAQQIHTTQGLLGYSKLVLAVGADPIKLDLAGDAADQVMSVNELADYTHWHQRLQSCKRVAILGAGLIGCEFANDLIASGYEVDVIDLAQQPLGRLLPPTAAQEVKDKLEQAGVRWHLGQSVTQVSRRDQSLELTLSGGAVLHTNAVLSAIGLRPRTDLARQAGLASERGIVVNRYLQTSNENVYALGDCAQVDGLVLPYVQPIMHAARALAKTLTGTSTPLVYPAMPVVVKTPAVPVVVSPPAYAGGFWKEAKDDGGVDARFEDAAGNLLGFALVGTATHLKTELTKRLPNVLI